MSVDGRSWSHDGLYFMSHSLFLKLESLIFHFLFHGKKLIIMQKVFFVGLGRRIGVQ